MTSVKEKRAPVQCYYCNKPALCVSGNAGNRLVCTEHFRVFNGQASTAKDTLRRMERERTFT